MLQKFSPAVVYSICHTDYIDYSKRLFCECFVELMLFFSSWWLMKVVRRLDGSSVSKAGVEC